MKSVTFKPVLSILVTIVALLACTMIPRYEQSAVNAPETFGYDMQAGTNIQATSLGWQGYFTDPRLYRLIDTALERNTDLHTVALDAKGLRKQYMISHADLLPGINATDSGPHGRTAKDLSSTDDSHVSLAYDIELSITLYELDLFDKVCSSTQAAL